MDTYAVIDDLGVEHRIEAENLVRLLRILQDRKIRWAYISTVFAA